ncbi:hypothetical protein [Maribacter stanieri]|uniref:hypothetical protein n=1 Tax=Maribacter stanieri TaxID=440514 RepID=UPI002493F4E8|nr:hypothetical protein [Maribacter stanieri]|tara:strand:+ start:1401 stop:2018 length:618 start_codon:yes stop_codon:yes gene_type:complete
MNNNITEKKESNITKGIAFSISLLIVNFINSTLEYFNYEKSWFYSFLATVTILLTYRVLLSIKTFLNENLNLKTANNYIYILIFTSIVAGLTNKLLIKNENLFESLSSNNFIIVMVGLITIIIIDFICYYKLASILSKKTNKTALNFSKFAYTIIVMYPIGLLSIALPINTAIIGLILTITPLIFLINGFHIAKKESKRFNYASK